MDNILEFKPRGDKVQPDEKSYLVKNGHSWCNWCKTVKTVDCFSKDKSNAYGFESVCTDCRREAAAKRRADNPEKTRAISLKSRNKNIEKARKRKSEWAANNKEWTNFYRRYKYNTEPKYRCAIVARQLVRRMLKTTGIKKPFRTQEVLGYTPQELKMHIEAQFKPGMNWDNYGKWHIDHIIPISSAKTLYEGIKLSQLDNLQPLWAEENLIKGNRDINFDN